MTARPRNAAGMDETHHPEPADGQAEDVDPKLGGQAQGSVREPAAPSQADPEPPPEDPGDTGWVPA